MAKTAGERGSSGECVLTSCPSGEGADVYTDRARAAVDEAVAQMSDSASSSGGSSWDETDSEGSDFEEHDPAVGLGTDHAQGGHESGDSDFKTSPPSARGHTQRRGVDGTDPEDDDFKHPVLQCPPAPLLTCSFYDFECGRTPCCLRSLYLRACVCVCVHALSLIVSACSGVFVFRCT